MRIVISVSRLLTALSSLCLSIMVVVTILDIALRLTINQLIFGVIEIVQFALVGLVFLAIPSVTLRQEHISIDLIDRLMPPAAVYGLRIMAALITALFLSAMTWRMSLAARDTVIYGGATPELHMHLIWYWLPMVVGTLYGAISAFFIVVLVIRHDEAAVYK